jgi:hypothetical protein
VDADAVRKLIDERFDLSLGVGLGKLKGRMFRIGHPPDLRRPSQSSSSVRRVAGGSCSRTRSLDRVRQSIDARASVIAELGVAQQS